MKNFIIYGLLCLVSFIVLDQFDTYTKEVTSAYIVLDKAIGYKNKCYLVLRDPFGRVFDIPVSVSTYSQASIGSRMTFKLREFDVKQTFKDNLIFFWFKSLLICAGLSFLLTSLFTFLWNKL